MIFESGQEKNGRHAKRCYMYVCFGQPAPAGPRGRKTPYKTRSKFHFGGSKMVKTNTSRGCVLVVPPPPHFPRGANPQIGGGKTTNTTLGGGGKLPLQISNAVLLEKTPFSKGRAVVGGADPVGGVGDPQGVELKVFELDQCPRKQRGPFRILLFSHVEGFFQRRVSTEVFG